MNKATDKESIKQLFDKAPTEFNNPIRETLNEADTGGLAMALLTLTQELWVLTDRVRVLEAVLEQKGIEIHDQVDRFQPDETLQAELDNKSQKLIASVLKALNVN
ncbi:hypothetical protein AB6T38_08840 [Aliiglaciecola sp. SL4]|uniref:hypothetical protein n=1 Tax=Aliiglaciecola sp. SL4 TaxID=3239806 RepID=UPI00355C0D24